MEITLKTQLGPFQGTPTAGLLVETLSVLPSNAEVVVTCSDNQMDGASWRAEATWVEDRSS